MLTDTFGRIINYVRISLTDRCNLRCRYCMPESGIVKLSHKEILTFEELYRLIEILKEVGIKKFRFTGGEPFVRKDAITFFENINLDKFYITTNFALPNLNVERINKLKIGSINISCDSLKPEKYSYITRGGDLNILLGNIKRLSLPEVKLNVVLIKNFNEDEVYDFIEFGIKHNIKVRFIEKMDIIYDNLEFLSLDKIKEKLIKENIIEESISDSKSVATYYKIKGEKNYIGFITPISNPFCDKCNKIRIKANGDIKLCIYSNDKYSIRERLRDNSLTDNDIKSWLYSIIKLKPYTAVNYNRYNEENMAQIGG